MRPTKKSLDTYKKLTPEEKQRVLEETARAMNAQAFLANKENNNVA